METICTSPKSETHSEVGNGIPQWGSLGSEIPERLRPDAPSDVVLALWDPGKTHKDGEVTEMTPKQKLRQTLESLRPLLTNDWHGEQVRVTEAVLTAVDEVLAEVHKPRTSWYTVATLLSCKSYLCGAMVEDDPFCEDRLHNELVLGEGSSVYTILDGAQFEAAMLADVLPSGMTCYTAQGKAEERYPTGGESATMRNIRIAYERVLRDCAARR